jgi:ribosome recycling factor
VKGRWLQRLTDHLQSTAQKSPFISMTRNLRKEILAAIRAYEKEVRAQIEKIYKEMVDDFDSMAMLGEPDPSELRVRRNVKEYLDRAQPKLSKLKTTLEELKADHARVELLEQ